MHELSIAQSILSIAEKAAPRDDHAVIKSVAVQIGELSGVEIEALKFAMSIIKEDTILQNAELNIDIIKGEAECLECGKIFPMNFFGVACPGCGAHRSKILKGREMKVVHLTVDEE